MANKYSLSTFVFSWVLFSCHAFALDRTEGNREHILYISHFNTNGISESTEYIFREVLSAELAKNNHTISNTPEQAAHLVDGSLSLLNNKIIVLIKTLHKEKNVFNFVQRVTIRG